MGVWPGYNLQLSPRQFSLVQHIMDTTWYHYSFGDTEKVGDVLIFALQSLEVDVHFPASVYSPCSSNMVTEQFWTWWDAIFGSFCYTFAATLLAHGSVNVESRTTPCDYSLFCV